MRVQIKVIFLSLSMLWLITILICIKSIKRVPNIEAQHADDRIDGRYISLISLNSIQHQYVNNFVDYNGFISEYIPISNATKQPGSYLHMDVVKQHKQLPFCILSGQAISIAFEYSNYKNVIIKQYLNISKNPLQSAQILRQIAQKQCPWMSILVLDTHISQKSLSKLNMIYQTTRTWMTYFSTSTNRIQISGIQSLYMALLNRMVDNDFDFKNAQLFMEYFHISRINKVQVSEDVYRVESIKWICLSLRQLAHSHAYRVRTPTYFSSKLVQNVQYGLLWYKHTHANRQQYLPSPLYQPLLSLSQNQPISLRKQTQQVSAMMSLGMPMISQIQGITHQHILMALQLQSLTYLPLQHSLHARNKMILQNNYGSLQTEYHHLCIIAYMRDNNIYDNGYVDMINSIIMQNYPSQYITVLLIDGIPSHFNMQLTKQYIDSIKQKHGVSINIQILTDHRQQGQLPMIKHIMTNNLCPGNGQAIMVILQQNNKILNSYALALINKIFIQEQILLVYSSYLDYNDNIGHSSRVYPQAWARLTTQYHHFTGGIISVRQTTLEQALGRLDRINMQTQILFQKCFYQGFIQYLLLEACLPHSIYFIPDLLVKNNKITICKTNSNINQTKNRLSRGPFCETRFSSITELQEEGPCSAQAIQEILRYIYLSSNKLKQ